jgi:hypothetical protein
LQPRSVGFASVHSPMGERVRGRANRRYRSVMSGSRIWLKDWAVDLALATVGGAFLGLIGPFGSYFNGPAWQRAFFQIVCFWAGILMFGTVIRILMARQLKPLAFWGLLGLSILIIDAPFSFVVSRFAQALWPRLHFPVSMEWYAQALITSTPVVVGYVFLHRWRKRQRSLAQEAAGAPPSHEGLLGTDPARVLCLQMEDHYVRVHTAAGSRLVLATLSQAMAALKGAEGLQVHRSWWVASKAVERVEQHGRNLRLRLSNGVTAPVARSAVAQVRAAGWIG